MSQPSNIALFGLGIIGERCAKRLSEAQYSLKTWNRTPKPHLSNFIDDPTKVASGADFILFYLKDGAACLSVFDQISSTLQHGQILINHSTIASQASLRLAEKCNQLGIEYLEAPFTGSKLAAQDGTLTYYAAGNVSTLEKARTLLEVTSKSILHLGRIGEAAILKIVTNMISAATVQVLSEALAITQRSGINPENLILAIQNNACNSTLAQLKLPSMIQLNFEPHFSAENMRKDSALALDLAHQLNIELPVTISTHKALTSQCLIGNYDLDYSTLFQIYSEAP